MSATPSYTVKVEAKSSNGKRTHTAYLQPAKKLDMPTNWDFDWQGFWQKADFDCEAIIKLTFHRRILGLINMANQKSSETDICQDFIVEESSQDIATAGSEKWMSHRERYEFVKNRTYSAIKPSSKN